MEKEKYKYFHCYSINEKNNKINHIKKISKKTNMIFYWSIGDKKWIHSVHFLEQMLRVGYQEISKEELVLLVDF